MRLGEKSSSSFGFSAAPTASTGTRRFGDALPLREGDAQDLRTLAICICSASLTAHKDRHDRRSDTRCRCCCALVDSMRFGRVCAQEGIGSGSCTSLLRFSISFSFDLTSTRAFSLSFVSSCSRLHVVDPRASYYELLEPAVALPRMHPIWHGRECELEYR